MQRLICLAIFFSCACAYPLDLGLEEYETSEFDYCRDALLETWTNKIGPVRDKCRERVESVPIYIVPDRSLFPDECEENIVGCSDLKYWWPDGFDWAIIELKLSRVQNTRTTIHELLHGLLRCEGYPDPPDHSTPGMWGFEDTNTIEGVGIKTAFKRYREQNK